MDKNELENLHNFYTNNLREKESEETIKMLVVKDLLHLLGYKKEWFKCEEQNMLGKSDIKIIPPNSNDILYIETKCKDYKITKKDYSQLSGYMDSTNTEWGIITNGNHYYLLNKSINGKSEERVILEYLLEYRSGFKYSKKQNGINLRYFSYDRIFKKKSTKYFAYFREYTIKNRIHSNDISFKQYQSANFNFFDYLDSNERICDESLLNPTRITGYFQDIVYKKQYAKSSLINKCSYIASTLKYLEDCGKLQTKHFNNFNSETFLSDIINEHCDKNSKEIPPLTLIEANSLLNYYSQNWSSYSRNKLLFKLYLFICPSIETIHNLKLDNFILRNNKVYLKISNYEFELPQPLVNDYNKYIKSRNARVVDPNFRYLFYTYYGKKCRQMSPTTIMSIINNSFNNLPNISDERKKQLNISTIQKSVITLMLTNGFSVEQISLFTELSVGTIYNYIDTKTLKNIATKTKKDLLSSKHPYAKLLF
ncbi:type I restriction enzyme HsdR N-terminal domain-containing protein [Clostridium beijerinckii]|uniref:Type I restriction enzyme HsdR N-terminal domain-containing protein n=1 Tax=Clostridium beijerinckii TaxID=1520 RepID=A0A7X9SL29_CLOBE|nr:type I restriction enzyme HsdR N-terminal domain-containing protein [Clostridium beijerinckii]NMF03909.1 type I restriction enzyme HsdR N-terminal domain-containing protein [Clostridium beijerinckii]